MKFFSDYKFEITPERMKELKKFCKTVHISFNARIMQYALENWPDSFYDKHYSFNFTNN